MTGASLLVFKNKSDVSGAMTEDEVREVRCTKDHMAMGMANGSPALTTRFYQDTQMDHSSMQRNDWDESPERTGVGGSGRERSVIFILADEL